MDNRKIQKLRAAVLNDLAKFIPNNFYAYIRTSIDLYNQDCVLAKDLRSQQYRKPKMTPRQIDAIELLDAIGSYGGAYFSVPEDVAAPLDNGITLEGIKETCFATLQEALSEYALHLSADKARVLLPNHAIKPATEQATDAPRKQKAKWTDAELRTLQDEFNMPGATTTSLGIKHGVTRQRISTLLKEAKKKFSPYNTPKSPFDISHLIGITTNKGSNY